jgi:hypothetical protein
MAIPLQKDSEAGVVHLFLREQTTRENELESDKGKKPSTNLQAKPRTKEQVSMHHRDAISKHQRLGNSNSVLVTEMSTATKKNVNKQKG